MQLVIRLPVGHCGKIVLLKGEISVSSRLSGHLMGCSLLGPIFLALLRLSPCLKILRKHGYRTIHAGKAHFGAKDTPGADPKNLGFDVNIAGSYMGGPGSFHGDKNFSAHWRQPGNHIWDIPGLEKYHGQKINLTEAITREAIAELEKSVAAKKPFYLYMSHYAVHAPFEPDRRFLPNYADKKWNKHKKVYASMLESMDRSLGDLMKTLDRLGVADNTIVVFMSDNGSPRNNPQNCLYVGIRSVVMKEGHVFL